MSRTLAPTAQAARRPRKDVLRNREHLLHVADELVAEQGLRISLNELAHRAGVGVGTVYRHFPDPQKVLDALFEQRVDTVSDLFRAAELVEDPLQALRQLLVSIGEVQAADRALFQVIAQSMTPDQHQRFLRGRLRPLAARIIERAQATGQLRPDFTTSDIPMIIQMLRAVSEYALDVRPDLWRRYLEVIIDGFLNPNPDREPPPALATPPLTRTQVDHIVAAHAQIKTQT